VGLPILAALAWWLPPIHLVRGEPNVWPQLAPLWFTLLICVSFLMVSTWRFYSFKDLNLRNRHPFQIFILILADSLAAVAFHHYMLFIICNFICDERCDYAAFIRFPSQATGAGARI